MSVQEILQFLAGPPYRVQRSEWPFITISQIKDIFFCERDENGVPVGVRTGRATYEEFFRMVWAHRGANEEQQTNLWNEFIRLGGEQSDGWRKFVDEVMGWQTQQQSSTQSANASPKP